MSAGQHTLVDFLLARIAEDEAEFSVVDAEGNRYGPSILDRKMLAECAAKRLIVEHCEPEILTKHPGDDYVLRLLALPYAEHPDYRDEWRPQ